MEPDGAPADATMIERAILQAATDLSRALEAVRNQVDGDGPALADHELANTGSADEPPTTQDPAAQKDLPSQGGP